MNENQVTIFTEFNEEEYVKEHKSSGVCYLLEVDNCVKIGCTSDPKTRYKALKHSIEKYGNSKIGRFYITKQCINYKEVESIIHNHFSDSRKNKTEIFNLSIEDVLNENLSEILTFNNDYKKHEEMINKRLEALKNLVIEIGLLKNIKKEKEIYNDIIMCEGCDNYEAYKNMCIGCQETSVANGVIKNSSTGKEYFVFEADEGYLYLEADN